MSYQREYYYDRTAREGRYPLDEQLGIAGHVSNGVKRELVELTARMPYAESVEVYARLARVYVSCTGAWEMTQAVGEIIRAMKARGRVSAKKGQADAESMAVTMDGCMAHVREEGWKEVKVGSVFELENRRKHRQNKQGETIPVVRAKDQTYVLHLGGPEEFGDQLVAETETRGWSAVAQSAVIGDGAAWIWNLANRDYPTSAHIVDWYHAKQHLFSAAQVIWRDTPDAIPGWVEQRAHLLYDGHADHIAERLLILASLSNNQEDKAGLESEAGYFITHHERMQYRDFQYAGLPIGSGTVESGAKQAKHRFSAAGMRWSRNGLQNMLPLRAAAMSNTFDHLWGKLCPY